MFEDLFDDILDEKKEEEVIQENNANKIFDLFKEDEVADEIWSTNRIRDNEVWSTDEVWEVSN